nr:DUF4386 domain-containing protein [Allomuricauda sp.]
MKQNQKTGRIVGLLLFLIMAAGIPSLNLRGLSTRLILEPNFMEFIHDHALGMRFAMLLDILTSALWLSIAIILFPMIKKYKLSLALTFFGLWLVNFGVIIYSNISHLSLISLSEHFMEMGALDQNALEVAGLQKIHDYFWAHFMALITYASAAFVLFYYLFRTRLVPRFLSVWGMGAISLVFLASWANIFDLDISFHFYSQNGLHMVTFIGWLLIKGFRNPTVTN